MKSAVEKQIEDAESGVEVGKKSGPSQKRFVRTGANKHTFTFSLKDGKLVCAGLKTRPFVSKR